MYVCSRLLLKNERNDEMKNVTIEGDVTLINEGGSKGKSKGKKK